MKNLKAVLFALALSLSSLYSSTAQCNRNIQEEKQLSVTETEKEVVRKFSSKQLYAGKIEGGMYEKFSGKNIPVRPKLLWYIDCQSS